MGKFCSVLFASFCLNLFISVSETSESVCRGEAGKKHRISLTINSIRNERDEWVTTISASQNASVKPKNLDVDLTRSVVDCEENYYVNVQGIVRDNAEESQKRRSLTFNHKCSSNAAITNNSRTLHKLKLDGQGSALTNRPLLDNEIFTVRIDRLASKFDYVLGIGITIHAPGTFEIPDHMNTLKTGTWMFYNSHLYHKSAQLLPGYLSKDLKEVKVGQHVGVMRSDSGALHVFLDGVDQGPAASNIPDTVYGVLECHGNLLQATIVDV